ncbi:MAG: SAM-dependent chlorinase/fluorinase [Methylococcales bacterium]|jgi:S-adenosyl-L-methionine hydrolase (adenosine-forming)|nr:SAM-dependent chlorinase/fluorinase [Methylococcales bacterium]
MNTSPLILLFSDFGIGSPYIAEIDVKIFQQNPRLHFIALLSDAPKFNIEASAYLLQAYLKRLNQSAVVMAIVDPGVGSDRKGVVIKCDQLWLIDPDNGILDRVCSLSEDFNVWDILWDTEQVSASFHGRDVFAPVAAKIASGIDPNDFLEKRDSAYQYQYKHKELNQIIYIDDFGNLMTGLNQDLISSQCILNFRDNKIHYARTFSDVSIGQLFWYINSIELVEISVNQGNAAQRLSASIGDVVIKN